MAWTPIPRPTDAEFRLLVERDLQHSPGLTALEPDEIVEAAGAKRDLEEVLVHLGGGRKGRLLAHERSPSIPPVGGKGTDAPDLLCRSRFKRRPW